MPKAVPTLTLVHSQDQVSLGTTEQSGPTYSKDFNAGGAPHKFSVTEVKTPVTGFASTELLVDPDPHFPQQSFNARGLLRDPEMIAAFGSDHPASGEVLLHYAGDPPAGAPKQDHPILLVHGANKNGKYFADPHEDGSGKDSFTENLRAQGYKVYAVSFADNQDDNFLQAQQISNSIQRILEKTGDKQVEMIAHSKGGVSARIYDTDYKQPWMTAYQNDVFRTVFVASPNGGLDYPLRHAGTSLALATPTDNPLLNAPMVWDNIKVWGVPVDTTEQSYESKANYWPGQAQLLARWDSKYPISYFEGMDPLTVNTTYNGGDSFVAHSPGIDALIKDGGNLIENLNKSHLDPRIGVALLAGDNPNIPGILNETTGPSDGLLFVDSALQHPSTDHIVKEGILHLNHKDLIAEPEGQQWILDALSCPDPKA